MHNEPEVYEDANELREMETRALAAEGMLAETVAAAKAFFSAADQYYTKPDLASGENLSLADDRLRASLEKPILAVMAVRVLVEKEAVAR